jgi:hypothetical protein
LAHRAVAASALVAKTLLEDWSARHLMIIHPCESQHLVKTVFEDGGASMRRGSRSTQPTAREHGEAASPSEELQK